MGLEACCVCGCHVYSLRDTTFVEDENWKKHHEHPGFLFMDAKELEGKYFKHDITATWKTFYRLSRSSPPVYLTI